MKPPYSKIERDPHSLKGLPDGWTHIVDILDGNRHCIGCVFVDADGNIRVRREGGLWVEHDTIMVGYTNPQQEIIIAPRRY